jgi:archaellum component FlaC
MKSCIKEKQIDKIEAIADKNNDTIIALTKDIGYIKEAVKEIKVNHLPHLKKDVADLGKNYLVFKTKVLFLWGLLLVILSILANKLVDILF